MRVERFIAMRYLIGAKKDGFVSVISFLSFFGIFLGVTALIIVMSVMNGFREELMKQLTGMNGHVIIYPVYGTNFTNYESLMQKLKPISTLVLPIIEQPTIMARGQKFDGVMLYGHDIDQLKQHSFFAKKLLAGSIEALKQPNTVMVGKRLADTNDIKINDNIVLYNPVGEQTMFGNMPVERDFKVVAIFELGMREYDKRFVFTSLGNAQDFYGHGKSITHMELFTKDSLVPKGMMNLIDQDLVVKEWQHMDAPLFQALNVEKKVMFIILALMIGIAVLNIISSLIMLVKDKTTQIAIFRSIGLSRRGILKVFFMNGAVIGVCGTALGLIAGLLFAHNFEAIHAFVERVTGTVLFNPEVHAITKIRAIVSMHDVLMISGLSLGCALLATLYPAYKASKLDPAPILR